MGEMFVKGEVTQPLANPIKLTELTIIQINCNFFFSPISIFFNDLERVPDITVPGRSFQLITVRSKFVLL